MWNYITSNPTIWNDQIKKSLDNTKISVTGTSILPSKVVFNNKTGISMNALQLNLAWELSSLDVSYNIVVLPSVKNRNPGLAVVAAMTKPMTVLMLFEYQIQGSKILFYE